MAVQPSHRAGPSPPATTELAGTATSAPISDEVSGTVLSCGTQSFSGPDGRIVVLRVVGEIDLLTAPTLHSVLTAALFGAAGRTHHPRRGRFARGDVLQPDRFRAPDSDGSCGGRDQDRVRAERVQHPPGAMLADPGHRPGPRSQADAALRQYRQGGPRTHTDRRTRPRLDGRAR